MKDYVFALVFGLCLGGIGNWIGDQATLRDCATRGEAKMAGGGIIQCTVMMELK